MVLIEPSSGRWLLLPATADGTQMLYKALLYDEQLPTTLATRAYPQVARGGWWLGYGERLATVCIRQY